MLAGPNDAGRAEEVAGPFGVRHLAPRFEGSRSRLDRTLCQLRGCLGHMPDDLGGIGWIQRRKDVSRVDYLSPDHERMTAPYPTSDDVKSAAKGVTVRRLAKISERFVDKRLLHQ